MIKKLELKNYTVFKRASFLFGNKINIFIGENGAGKTQILKLLYAIATLIPLHQKEEDLLFAHVVYSKDLEIFKSIFKIDIIAELVNLEYRNKKTKIEGHQKVLNDQGKEIDLIKLNLVEVESKNKIYFENNSKSYQYNIDLKYRDIVLTNMLNSKKTTQFPSDLIPEVLFLPTRELLTIYPNYQSLSKRYHLPYDQTYDDTIVALGLPYEKEKVAEYDKIITKLEKAIDGKIFLRNEKFYFHPNSALPDQDLDINMTAEGWRKLGMILQLLRNGGLHSGMALFWDEPEANLNPQLIRLIAQVILELSQMNIQVFLATQSLFLVYELELLIAQQKIKDGVRYFNLQKGKPVEQGDTFPELKNVLLVDESIKQSDQYLVEEF